MRKPDDSAARARALDPGASFIVQAPAGSGKTELLIQRYLRLLSVVEEPEAVVAVTFTRKAAAEMRVRILAALRRAAEDLPPAEPHAKVTWELARSALLQDRARNWRLLEHSGRLRLMTMDALCASICRRMPWVSRMGGPQEVTENANDLYGEAARAALSLIEHGERPTLALERMLLHLDSNFFNAQELLVKMLARRDQWLPHVSRSNPSELRAHLERSIQAEIVRGLKAARAVTPEIPGHVLPGTDVTDLEAWRETAQLLLTKDGTIRKRGAGEFGAFLTRLTASPPDLSALHEVRKLPPAQYAPDQWEVLESLCTVLRLAAAQLKVVFSERGMVDFIEVAEAALHALGDADDPSDLAFALDHRIHHLLVDEFQDTSVVQWQLLEKLTAGWTHGDGRTLFVVGDPMQSIYRFRDAEVGLYLRARKEGIGQLPLEALRLTVNFRSTRAATDWFNQTFARVFPAEEDIETGAVAYTACESGRGGEPDAPAVTVHPFFSDDRAAEGERVVELVQECRANRPQEKVAILVRARTHLPYIVKALKTAGISFRAVEIDPLSDRPVVQDLLSLTRALLHLADRPAWLAILRAPWCGLKLEDLHALAAPCPKRIVWELICDPAACEKLTPDGRERLERLRATIEPCILRRGTASLRQWVEAVWLALGGPACADGETAADDARAFLELLDEMQAGGTLDMSALDGEVKRLYSRPSPEAGDLLQVMSIHKAKGLEFDTVILPGLGRRPPVEFSPLLLWLERASNSGLLMAPIKEIGGNDDPCYEYLKELIKRKNDQEKRRLLYVAATRARQRLHLLGHIKMKEKDGITEMAPDSQSLLACLWPCVEEIFKREMPATIPEDVTAPNASRFFIRRVESGWRVPEMPPAVEGYGAAVETVEERPVTYIWAGDTLRHAGIVVHRMLLRIAREGLNSWDNARIAAERTVYTAMLRSLGTPPSAVAETTARVEAALRGVLASERGRWVLQVHGGAQCEYALSGAIDGRVCQAVIDRTFVDDEGTRWIIDYKTGMHEGGSLSAFLDNEEERYRAQMERYGRLMLQKERRPVRLGLFFPLLAEWREYTGLALDRVAEAAS